MLLTRDFDDVLRRAEMAGIRSGIESAAQLYPGVAVTALEIAGGLVAFTGIESPLSQAFGVGAVAPVSQGEVAAITSFYESRGSTPRVFVTPLSDPSLGLALVACGYAPAEYETVLAAEAIETEGLLDARVAVAENLDEWAAASAKGFTGRDEPESGDSSVARIIASSRGAVALELRAGAEIAATGAIDLRGEVGSLFAASTLPVFRGRGLQAALIRDRIARAKESGARYLRATAAPASISERNFRRCGFDALYTRVLWERKLF